MNVRLSSDRFWPFLTIATGSYESPVAYQWVLPRGWG